MPRIVKVHPKIESDDLPEIYAYIAREDAEAARGVIYSTKATFQMLGQFPEIGTRYMPNHSDLQGIRMFPVQRYRKNFLIFYRSNHREVCILYVYRSSRDVIQAMSQDPREA
jgi:toxin ParE1/3/4